MIDEKALEINELIKNSSEYKSYLQCKAKVDKSLDLMALKSRLQELKSINCKGRNDSLINEYYALEKEYNDNVYVKEYNSAKSELRDLIVDICDILSLK